MLLASGVNFGFRRTIPHMIGISAGFAILTLCLGSGIGALIAVNPQLDTILKVIGAGYLLYLAWRIGMSRQMDDTAGKARPMRFIEAAAFQWVNPKAWTMALTAIVLFTEPSDHFLSLATMIVIFVMLNFPSVMIWTAFGTFLRQFLSDPTRLKYFNITMGILLALTVIAMVW